MTFYPRQEAKVTAELRVHAYVELLNRIERTFKYWFQIEPFAKCGN